MPLLQGAVLQFQEEKGLEGDQRAIHFNRRHAELKTVVLELIQQSWLEGQADQAFFAFEFVLGHEVADAWLDVLKQRQERLDGELCPERKESINQILACRKVDLVGAEDLLLRLLNFALVTVHRELEALWTKVHGDHLAIVLRQTVGGGHQANQGLGCSWLVEEVSINRQELPG